MRVLVVDDERNIRPTLRVCLEGFGREVREAATPEAALAALAQGPADLAFVDLRLGTARSGSSGWARAERGPASTRAPGVCPRCPTGADRAGLRRAPGAVIAASYAHAEHWRTPNRFQGARTWT
ncbi:transcriptional regulator [Corallococcus macrosporus DSM 14697]|uniref:Transcriptional regulator n=1 Tax=Corallococcus macrosporus DSM 14697 TaxID=1189310 RepID=A0A250JLU6_9BACT|nr:transcriptional regulator [Corallococcus macrosporus DSM 14697]